MDITNGPYDHPEAFCLMAYQCERCGGEEVVWNSADSVTPFLIDCRDCRGMAKHVRWQQDVRAPDHQPAPGERFFAPPTDESRRRAAQRIVDRAWNHPEYPLSARYSTRQEATEALLVDLGRDATPQLLVAAP